MDRRELLWGSTAVVLASSVLANSTQGAERRADDIGGLVSALVQPKSRRETLSVNKGWRFFDGEVVDPSILTQEDTVRNAKAGAANGAAAPSFDDSAWLEVGLPHDFAVYRPVTSDANQAQGYRKRGIAWYRNVLRLDPGDHGKHLELTFDGIATHATVWFNGIPVAHNWSGYNAVTIDITPYATFGEEYNTIAVRADADAMEGWWYEGGGLYRNVWLVKRDSVHIVTDGVFAHPVRVDGRWQIPVEITLENSGAKDEVVSVVVELFDGTRRVTGATADARAQPLDRAVAHFTIDVDAPRLWSPDTPELYRVEVRLVRSREVIDALATDAGFRTQLFDAETGFYLNDKPLKINGVCIHQDHAGVGVAVPYGILEYRLRRLKDLGCNAIRCAHHAQIPYFYELCNRFGFLVMDENRVFNPSADYISQLTWMVRRDRNHPCVILWSVFNEEPMQATEAGYEMVRRMVHEVKRLDTSRPVTAAMNEGHLAPVNVSQAVDVVGFNYNSGMYDAFHKAFPEKPMISSEDTSALGERGCYVTDAAGRHIASLDDPNSWGASHRNAAKPIRDRRFIAASFVWSGFDYRGEPTPYTFPSNLSFYGIMDSCGFEKPAFWIHKAQWTEDVPVLYVAPHWNWEGREGQAIKVLVCSNAHEVELFLNGKSMGRQKADRDWMNTYIVPYAPGRLHAVGYRDGKPVSTYAVETTGKPVRLRLTPFRDHMLGDGLDAQPLTVEALDDRGRPVPVADHDVTFSIENGAIIGVGNGNPNSLEPDKSSRRRLFNGLAQVIVRSQEGMSGMLTLTASAPGLEPTRLNLAVIPAAPRPSQATTQSVQTVGGWIYHDPTAQSPDPQAAPDGDDLTGWHYFRTGSLLQAWQGEGHVLCAASFTPHANVRRDGGTIDLFGVTGAAEVYVDGIHVASKPERTDARLSLILKPEGARTERRISLIFKVARGEFFGLSRGVRVRYS